MTFSLLHKFIIVLEDVQVLNEILFINKELWKAWCLKNKTLCCLKFAFQSSGGQVVNYPDPSRVKNINSKWYIFLWVHWLYHQSYFGITFFQSINLIYIDLLFTKWYSWNHKLQKIFTSSIHLVQNCKYISWFYKSNDI